MKQTTNKTVLCLQPVPKTIVSCRDKQGRDNALVVGFTANISLDPPMVMVGIVPTRFSHHIVKESGCFVVNIPGKDFAKEYAYLGSHSGRDEDKFQKLGLQTEEAEHIDAPLLSGCPVNIECEVVSSVKPGTHELFMGKVLAVHVDQQYLAPDGTILWDKMDLL